MRKNNFQFGITRFGKFRKTIYADEEDSSRQSFMHRHQEVRRDKASWTIKTQATEQSFFCWWLLGLILGGAPFSQLNKGVKDTMVESTKLVKCQFVTKTCKKAEIETTRKREGETGNHPQIGPGLQKRARVKSSRQHLCRRSNETT